MTFGAVFPRVFRPAFGPGLAAVAAAANWWEAGGASGAVAAYQPKGAASLAASYISRANPGTYDAAPGVAPTWASGTGWTFNGSTQYLTTGVAMGSGYTMIARYSGVLAATGSILGARSATPYFYMRPRSSAASGRSQYVWGAASLTGAALNQASGVVAMAGNACYFNGSLEGSVSSTFSGSSVALFVGAYNNGSPADFFAGNVLAVAIYNTTLTAPQVAAISTAMAAL